MRVPTFMRLSRMEAGRLSCGRPCSWATTTPTIWVSLWCCGASWARGLPIEHGVTLGFSRFEDAHGNGLNYLLVDFVDGEVALDADDAVGVTASDLDILLPNAGIEFLLLPFEAPLVFARKRCDAVVATARAFQAGFERGQQKQREVGLKSATEYPMHCEHGLRAKLAASPLIRLRRVCKSIAEDCLSGRQCGLNHFGNGLRAVRKHQRHLCQRRQLAGTRVKQQFADAVASCGAAGLAGDHGSHAPLLHPCCQALQLRGLSRSIESFKGDKAATHHGESLPSRPGGDDRHSSVLQEVGFLTILGTISFFYAGPIGVNMKIIKASNFAVCLLSAIALVAGLQLNAQNLTLEGQTGGFI